MTRHLVEEVLAAAGVSPGEVAGCLSADLPGEVMTALEGHWSPPASLLLAFDPETAARHPEADLVAPGSFRLERFLAWIRREAGVSRAALPPLPRDAGRALLSRLPATGEPGLSPAGWYLLDQVQVWEPHLVVAFLAARIGVVRQETLHVPGINLVTGRLTGDLRPHLPREAATPAGPEARRRLAYRHAYQALLLQVAEAVRAEDPSWAREALARYAAETERLEAFYAELARENAGSPEALAQLSANLDRRLHEQQDRFRPRVQIRPLAAALLQVPVLNYVFLVCDGPRERRRTITFDPLLGELRPLATPPPPPPGPASRTPPSPPPGCPPQPPPAAWRWPG